MWAGCDSNTRFPDYESGTLKPAKLPARERNEGLEPSTYCLEGNCSTTELISQICFFLIF